MPTKRCTLSRFTVLGLAAMLSIVQVAPIVAHAQGEPIAAAPALPSWDEASGYASVETTRAGISAMRAASVGLPNLDPAGVRWAPARAIAPVAPAEASRVIAAQQALLSRDLGSLQEEALTVVVASALSWDETSGYGAVEANRAAMRSMSSTALPEDQSVPLARGTPAESILLWPILRDDTL